MSLLRKRYLFDKKELHLPLSETKKLMTDQLKTEDKFTYAEAGEGPAIIILHGLMGTLSNFNETFNHDQLEVNPSGLNYKTIKAKHIVFAEGFGLKQNPFFNYLPLNGTKGELLIIKAPKLKLDYVLKSSAFLIPLKEEDQYTVGATYEWTDKTNNITQKAKEELLNKLKTFLKCDFEVVNQVAGIRPTVAGRRPLVGVHPKQTQLIILSVPFR